MMSGSGRREIGVLAASFCLWASPATTQDSAVLQSCTKLGATQPEIIGDIAVTMDDYPLISLATKEQGRAVLDVDVSTEGAVAGARIAQSAGSYRLDERSIAMVRERWRFAPASLDSSPVACTTQVAVRWELDSTPPASPVQLSDELRELLRDLRSR